MLSVLIKTTLPETRTCKEPRAKGFVMVSLGTFCWKSVVVNSTECLKHVYQHLLGEAADSARIQNTCERKSISARNLKVGMDSFCFTCF